MEEVIMNSGHGRPSLYYLNQHYKKIDYEQINESCVGTECILIYKYLNKLYGNFHQDVLCNGVFINGCYDSFIHIKDTKINKIMQISKKRFLKKYLEIYTKVEK